MSDKYTVKQQQQADEQQLKTAGEQSHREIGGRKPLEEALDVSNTELRDFVHTVSHDLREPLRKISSFGLLLKESLEGKLEKQDQENLECVIDGAERMTRMIEDLLAYSRTNAKTIAAQMVDLNEVVEQLEQLEIGTLLEETGAAIEIPQPLPRVRADAVLIQQLLRNLVVSAIQRRRQDVSPRILMRAEQIAGNEVRIEVQDNGIGVETKDGKDVFKLFARLHGAQEKEDAGTGLAVCKKIVDKHGGRIGVKSEAGMGSTFWFTLPASKDLQQHDELLLSAETGSRAGTAPAETGS
jgi:light-regulated signal transduction histidine kinase (bacteriophytochrome)